MSQRDPNEISRRRLLTVAGAGMALAGVTRLGVRLAPDAAQAAGATGVAAMHDTSKMKIALSNSYAGNTWRQQMLKAWERAGKSATDGHVIAQSTVVNSDNSATQQNSQIENLILQRYNAIVINATSPAAENGVIKKATDAGIVVVSFDSVATEPSGYQVNYDYVDMGRQEAKFVIGRLQGKGNVLEVRGIAGTSVDDDIHNGIVKGFADAPGIKLVGSVHGNWTQTIAQKEVAGLLPSLPPVDAVVTQGGDGYGTYQAFKAAGRKTPLIIMGHRGDEFRLWQQLLKENPNYDTFSISSTPGCASAAFWVAQQILAGKQVPKKITLPLPVLYKDSLPQAVEATPPDGVLLLLYTQDWTAKLIDAANTGGAIPPSPKPMKL